MKRLVRSKGARQGALRVLGGLLASSTLLACPQPPPRPPPPVICSRTSYDLRQLTGLPEPLGARALRAEDVTGDGYADLLLLLKERDLLVVMRGEPAGGFSFLQSHPVGSTPNDIAVADLNADGHQDVLVVGHFSNALTVLLGRGGGAFRTPVSYSLGNHSQQLKLADFNQDGHLDVVTKNGGSGGYFNITLLLGRGDGTFGAATPYPLSDAPMGMEFADLNQDGKKDVLVAVANRRVVETWLARGDGTLSASGELLLSEMPLQLSVSDVNGDTREDLLVMHGFARPGYMALYLRKVDGTFMPEQQLSVPSPSEVVSEDMDGDRAKDLVVSSLRGSVLLLKGQRDGSFASPRSLYTGSWPTSLAASDLDMNGHMDLAWTVMEDKLEVLSNVSACENEQATPPAVTPVWQPPAP